YYDPAKAISTVFENSKTIKRRAHTAAGLANGKVLIAGGGTGGAPSTAEIFDPATKTFTPTGHMHVGRYFFTATLLGNGRVLVAGGSGSSPSSAELFNPATGPFALTGWLSFDRILHAATLLTSGAVQRTGAGSSTG